MSIIRYLSKLNNFLTRKKFLKKSVISIYKYSSETTNSVHIDLEEDLTNDQLVCYLYFYKQLKHIFQRL